MYRIKKAQTIQFVLHLLNGRGSKNRTRISGFGDRYTAFVLYPYVPNNNTTKKLLKQEKNLKSKRKGYEKS